MVTHGIYDQLFIGGQWVASEGGGTADVISPSTEVVIDSVVSASKADVDRAVSAARSAFETGEWARSTPADRAAILRRFRDLLSDHREELANLLTDEIGCPVTQTRTVQLDAPLAVLDAYLALAPEYPFRSIRTSAGGRALITREPVGVVAAIAPWNVPVGIAVQKMTPALLAGCTVVFKPAPESPLNAYRLAELFVEAGLPPGVVNVVPADRDVSSYLVSHPGVDKVTFTGSTAAGRRIASLCGQDIRRVSLELGGKSAGIVLDDADLDATVESLRMGSLRNSGQICTLKTRLLVSKRRHADFVDRLTGMVGSMPVGDPHDADTQIGPMITAAQRDRVEGYISSGRQQGGRIVLGGGRPAHLDRGWFVEPTIFTDVTPDMTIAQEEIFGPVLAVLTYDDEDEAVAIANDSAYGLNGAVYTTDLERGLALAQRIRSGAVEINGSPIGPTAPMGGFKCSGLGRENGPEGLSSFLEPRAIGLPAGFDVTGLPSD
jgi:acyl-CoA reductase-like NAD-dependent aldehyde dehydrogenase